MNCESWRAAEELLHRPPPTGLALIISCGISGSVSRDIAQALLHGALHAHEADAERVLRHLADAAHAAVAEVVDVVDRAAAVLELDQVPNRLQDVPAA